MNYKVIDREKYYRKGVFRHFSEDCKCSASITARIDVTELAAYSRHTGTKFYAAACRDVEEAKKTREYGLDLENHPNWFDASFISWLSYDSLNIELPDGYLFFAPIINWGKYREENGRLVMPVTVRMNHAIADGFLIANVFRLLEQEIASFVRL